MSNHLQVLEHQQFTSFPFIDTLERYIIIILTKGNRLGLYRLHNLPLLSIESGCEEEAGNLIAASILWGRLLDSCALLPTLFLDTPDSQVLKSVDK